MAAQGYSALLDASSIDFEGWMGGFMVVPMVRWMRVRGCTWRDGVETSVAMLLPIAAVIVLRGVGLTDTLRWLSNSEHPAMFIGMLVHMVYRRKRYTGGYSFVLLPAAANSRASGAQPAQPEQSSSRVGAR